jgi:hypothetical protein
MRTILLVLIGGLGIACGSSKTSSDGGTCANASFSAPCVTGAVCEYFSPLACEAGCAGGNYVRWECIDRKWEDTRHTVGSPSCYCRQTDAQVDADGEEVSTSSVGP